MTVLALNPFGARLGWFMAPAVGPVRFGTAQLAETTDPGAYFASIDGFLALMLPQVDGLAARQPFISGDAAFAAALKNVGMLAHIIYQASFFPHLGAVSRFDMSTARLTLAGYGHANDEQMIAAARRDGIEVIDEHQAGAYAIWRCTIFGAAERRRPARTSKGHSLMKGSDR